MEVTTQDIAVRDESQVAEARRRVADLARRHGFDDVAAGRAAIVATELATNLLRHGGGGRLLISACQGDPAGETIECLALDSGPGIVDLTRALEDGFSTGGSAGQGLGAIRRQSDAFDIYSHAASPLSIGVQPAGAPTSSGTVVMARIAKTRPRRPLTDAPYAVICTALAGEPVSGDAWAVVEGETDTTAIVADGLGHGLSASAASKVAIDAFQRQSGASLTDILQLVHTTMRPTRGGAVSLVRLPHRGGPVRFTGIGNVAGSVSTGGREKRMVSHNGTAGHIARNIQEFTYDLPPGSLVILHSDGLGTSWQLDKYPGLRTRHPAVVAGVLYRDFARGRDDATVLVLRQRGPA